MLLMLNELDDMSLFFSVAMRLVIFRHENLSVIHNQSCNSFIDSIQVIL